MSFAAIMAVGFAADLVLGWPAAICRRIGHPVIWIGALIALLERRLNHGGRWRRRLAGAGTALLVIACASLPAAIAQSLLPGGAGAVLIGGLLAWPLLATRSMHDHIRAVRDPLLQGRTGAARAAVAMIVGRRTESLDDGAIARAALESLAENSSDGIVAPLFWGLLAGLPGIAAYKAINTMDSMIGHRTPRHRDFGAFAARLDDLVNLVPARLTALVFVLAAGRRWRHAWLAAARDSRLHRSPNAGWPEAAMAGALDLRLSGPRDYGGGQSDDPWLNVSGQDARPSDLAQGLALFRRAMAMIGLALVLAAALQALIR